MPIKIDKSEWSGWHIASIEGDFTSKSLIEVKALFEDLKKSQKPKVAIDLSTASFIDATAIQLMINYYKHLKVKGGKFKIFPSPDALDILKMLCVNELIELCISKDSFERTC